MNWRQARDPEYRGRDKFELRAAEKTAWQNYKGQIQREVTLMLRKGMGKGYSTNNVCDHLSDYARELGAIWQQAYRQLHP